MKKLFCIVILLLLLGIPVNCAVTDSNNAFEIALTEVPAGGGKPKSHDGLSGGAVTAIALGSTFGGLGILSGIGYYFFKHSKGLACGYACGEKCPYQPVGIENSDFITKSRHTYLIKAYEYAQKGSKYRYLIIPDTTVKPNTYNTVFFEMPDEFVNADFKIIQSSAPYSVHENVPELDTNILFGSKNVTKIPTSTVDFNSTKGILIKHGKISANENKIMALTTTYQTTNKLSAPKAYAIIVVFEKL